MQIYSRHSRRRVRYALRCLQGTMTREDWAALFLAAVWATWPAPPWDALTWGGGALMLAMPFLCYPFSKTVFLAFDLAFRPPTDTGDAP